MSKRAAIDKVNKTENDELGPQFDFLLAEEGRFLISVRLPVGSGRGSH